MITAKEATELSETISSEEAKAQLEKVEQAIRFAAGKGLKSVTLYHPLLNSVRNALYEGKFKVKYSAGNFQDPGDIYTVSWP